MLFFSNDRCRMLRKTLFLHYFRHLLTTLQNYHNWAFFLVHVFNTPHQWAQSNCYSCPSFMIFFCQVALLFALVYVLEKSLLLQDKNKNEKLIFLKWHHAHVYICKQWLSQWITLITVVQNLITEDRSCQNWNKSAFIMAPCNITPDIMDNYQRRH